ncbi:YgeY family selenium metabolism-linked hydrolase [Nocardioides islandensis]|uniref:YgeY family selenium metabolism-linked hydrolase n=1 Tax=Nocardioides islandensis TaxID=433663 RepID=A0A930VAZ6_9ACTN|nr:YgeY family selenium metabolism-linked hydrolase [Nocardioides islandensis]MBF4761618.1 YgeY family selenium metabolism-linked hydrolase [Nocardioides islandensis]
MDPLTQLALRLIATPSLSTEEGDCAALVAEELRRLGLTVDVDEMGNVVGRLELGPGPTVMVDCHLDTVPVVDASEWTRAPYGEVVDGRLYGRGAVDMKGPMAAVLEAIDAIRTTDRGTLVFAGTLAEELVEGPATIAVAGAVQPDYVVICEPSQRRVARGQRGRAEVAVEIHGLSSHSAYPSEGVNAAEVMTDVITGLRALRPIVDSTLGEGILVLIDLKSEPYPSLSTVPERCRATFDRRTLVGESQDDVLGPIREVVDRVTAAWGATGTVEVVAHRHTNYSGTVVETTKFAPAWLFSHDDPVVARAVAGLGEAGLDAVVTHYRFCTNGSATAGRLGIPTIGYGPGHEDQAHKVDEHIDLDDLRLGARGYVAILTALLAGEAP